jgi:hypothetical protein
MGAQGWLVRRVAASTMRQAITMYLQWHDINQRRFCIAVRMRVSMGRVRPLVATPCLDLFPKLFSFEPFPTG